MTCKRKERNRQKVDNIGDCNIKVIGSSTFFSQVQGNGIYKALHNILHISLGFSKANKKGYWINLNQKEYMEFIIFHEWMLFQCAIQNLSFKLYTSVVLMVSHQPSAENKQPQFYIDLNVVFLT